MARNGHSTTKGGAFRGTERKDVHTAKYTCPLCGETNTKRKSTFVRGARFCKTHGEPHKIIEAMIEQKKEQKTAA